VLEENQRLEDEDSRMGRVSESGREKEMIAENRGRCRERERQRNRTSLPDNVQSASAGAEKRPAFLQLVLLLTAS
jgi:hypothetical protein